MPNGTTGNDRTVFAAWRIVIGLNRTSWSGKIAFFGGVDCNAAFCGRLRSSLGTDGPTTIRSFIELDAFELESLYHEGFIYLKDAVVGEDIGITTED
jgi:hypothetical protein